MSSPQHLPPQALIPDAVSGFVPRKEFQPSSKRYPSCFSILCLAGSNLVRLYAFPSSVVGVFRHFFERRKAIRSERVDPNNNFTEFELEGKLWVTKSLSTERLLVEMFAIIYQTGFSYLSTIDYGRESDDRVAITFSKPCLPSEFLVSSSSSSPQIPSLAPIPDLPRPRVPFALSFTSATVLRVICPPLHSTPAILQAVRGAWPRGTQSEKKVGENSFEFKLKGYKWFQEDTFATDSLRYILALLSSLDAQSFTLQASISLTNRARNKDLWIFTGPPPPDELESPPPSILSASHSDVHSQHLLGSHTHVTTEPIRGVSSLSPYHGRAATESARHGNPHNMHGSSIGSSGSLPSSGLRKAAPRAQIPVSVYDTDEPALYRADLPSMIPDSVENMTGVGAGLHTPDVFYSTPPFGDAAAVPLPLSPVSHTSPSPTAVVLPLPSPRGTPPPQESPTSESIPEDVAPDTPSPDFHHAEGELLPPGVFKDSGIYRDSTFSSNTDFSAEIPIKWTGAQREDSQSQEKRRLSDAEGPKLPGGWEPTPVEEKEEPIAVVNPPIDIHLEQEKEPEGPVHDVRVALPEIIRPRNETRKKSEAGVVEIPSTSPPPLPTIADVAPAPKEREVGSGVGWVLVNIEGKDPEATATPASNATDNAAATSPSKAEDDKGTPVGVPTSSQLTSDALTAKTITILESPEEKKGRSKKEQSRIKRLLSITRRDSNKTVDETPVEEKSPRMRPFRGNRRPLEAKRNEDNRRSFD